MMDSLISLCLCYRGGPRVGRASEGCLYSVVYILFKHHFLPDTGKLTGRIEV